MSRSDLRLTVGRTASLATIGGLTAFLGPPTFDDGFVILRGRHLASGAAANLLDPYVRGSVNAQGLAYESIIGELAQAGDLVLLRLVPVILVVVAWSALEYSWVGRRFGEIPQRGRWLAWSVFAIAMPTLGGSLRAEAATAALLTFTLVAGGAGTERLGRTGFIPVLLPAVLAISIHQSGWSAVVAAGASILIAVRQQQRGRRVQTLLFTGAASTTLGVGAVLAAVPMSLAISSSARHLEFVGGRGLRGSEAIVAPHQELDRYAAVLGSGLEGGSFPHTVILILAVILPATLLFAPDRRRESLDIILLVAALGLALTSSKQAAHVMTLTPVAAIAVARFDVRSGRHARTPGSLVLAVIFSLTALHSLGRRGFAGFQTPLWGTPLAPSVEPGVERLFLLIVAGAAMVSVARFVIRMERERPDAWPLPAVTAVAALVAIGGLAFQRSGGVMMSSGPTLGSAYVVGVLVWLSLVLMVVRGERSRPVSMPTRLLAYFVGGVTTIVIGVMVIDAPAAVVLAPFGLSLEPGALSGATLRGLSELLRPWAFFALMMASLRPVVTAPSAAVPETGPVAREPEPDRPGGPYAPPATVLVSILLVVVGLSWNPIRSQLSDPDGPSPALELARSGLSSNGTCSVLAQFVAAAGGDWTDVAGADAADSPMMALNPCIQPSEGENGLYALPERLVTVTDLGFLFEHLPPERYPDPECHRIDAGVAPWNPEPLIDQVCVFEREVAVGDPELQVVARSDG